MGAGKLGFNLASYLIDDGHQVNFIEKNEKRCNEVANALDCNVIFGSATDRKTLENAQIMDANVFIAATANDESNLMACLLAGEYKVEKIISRVNDTNHEEIFLETNLIKTIHPESLEAGYMEKLVLKPKISDLYIISHGKAEILEINLIKKFIGKRIGDLSPKEDYMICGVYKAGEKKITLARPDIILKKGDKISILVKKDSMKDVLNIFT